MKNGGISADGVRVSGRVLRGSQDFAALDDRTRLPWRFLARRMAVDGLRR